MAEQWVLLTIVVQWGDVELHSEYGSISQTVRTAAQIHACGVPWGDGVYESVVTGGSVIMSVIWRRQISPKEIFIWYICDRWKGSHVEEDANVCATIIACIPYHTPLHEHSVLRNIGWDQINAETNLLLLWAVDMKERARTLTVLFISVPSELLSYKTSLSGCSLRVRVRHKVGTMMRNERDVAKQHKTLDVLWWLVICSEEMFGSRMR